ncbi:hypothetical protein ACDF64_15645 [Agromyces sp. MMS24-JH15]|uniref:hypothetical protein n=1 Tax=Agromyces sp. MMS24-JH15 TaxID=3243765 RepID=UPI003749B004
MDAVRELVEVWTDDGGAPVRMVWRARRFRVSDTPTTLVGPAAWWAPFSGHDAAPGHPPLTIAGWRFQATADDGETHVFDLERVDGRWRVLRVFD